MENRHKIHTHGATPTPTTPIEDVHTTIPIENEEKPNTHVLPQTIPVEEEKKDTNKENLTNEQHS